MPPVLIMSRSVVALFRATVESRVPEKEKQYPNVNQFIVFWEVESKTQGYRPYDQAPLAIMLGSEQSPIEDV